MEPKPKEAVDSKTIVPPKKQSLLLAVEEASRSPASPHGSNTLAPALAPQKHQEGQKFPHSLTTKLNLVLGQDGRTYAVYVFNDMYHALPVGSKHLNNQIRRLAQDEGISLRESHIREINEMLEAHAEEAGVVREIYYRVAPFQDGIELDVGDNERRRIRITANKVEILSEGSEILFSRTPTMLPFVLPADVGDLFLINRYLNLHPADGLLLIGWVTYTIAHPKAETTNYVHLILGGDRGCGKTTMSEHIIEPLIDPSIVGVQSFPKNADDLAISAQSAHVLFYDNMRSIRPGMADVLSMAATGAAQTKRRLYKNAEQTILRAHVPIVLNGIHALIDQPDLAQRCLTLNLLPIDKNNRKSQADFHDEFQRDLPTIFRGLLDLISKILFHLPATVPENPERMIEFSHWLAAMEKALDTPSGVLQSQYAASLKDEMLEGLLDNPLAAAVMDFADHVPDKYGESLWSGTPTELLQCLSNHVDTRMQRSRDWPQSPASLSLRLKSLKGGLLDQDIDVQFTRGRHRKITITKMGESNDE